MSRKLEIVQGCQCSYYPLTTQSVWRAPDYFIEYRHQPHFDPHRVVSLENNKNATHLPITPANAENKNAKVHLSKAWNILASTYFQVQGFLTKFLLSTSPKHNKVVGSRVSQTIMNGKIIYSTLTLLWFYLSKPFKICLLAKWLSICLNLSKPSIIFCYCTTTPFNTLWKDLKGRKIGLWYVCSESCFTFQNLS